jgi:hypothetical protein
MRFLIVPIFFLAACSPLLSQSKEDYVWKIGYGVDDTVYGFGGVKLDFNTSPPTISKFSIPIELISGIAEINSVDGIPLFYCNGCGIANSADQWMDNGHQINPGPFHGYECGSSETNSYLTHQGAIALPWPGHYGQYVVFHLGYDGYPDLSKLKIRELYHTEIDMTADNGLGKVVTKNTLLLYDSLLDNITAVRHGNGRDWWIAAPKNQSDTIFLFLLDTKGIHGPLVQKTGLSINSQVSFTAGQALFAPDGSKYVRESPVFGVDIFNFDRCSGTLFGGQRLPYPGLIDGSFSGAAISSSSRLLYVSTSNMLFQYDLSASDIQMSKILIDNYDGFIDSTKGGGYLPTLFYQMQLAPNGNIYMSATDGLRFLHTIHTPDSMGIACNFKQHDLKTPNHLGVCLPNFPNFRLYDLSSSVCDTLGINATKDYENVSSYETMEIYPNPVPWKSDVNVYVSPPSSGILRVTNINGALVREYEMGPGQNAKIDCEGFSSGMYVITFLGDTNQRPLIRKLIVTK